MPEHERMLERGRRPPTAVAVEAWLGARAAARWRKLTAWIDATYPGVFAPDWIYGGRKHGWALRYRKGRAFCTLVPEAGRAVAVVVLGTEERVCAEAMLASLGARTRAAYRKARTFADGKWIAVPLESAADLADLEALLALKRPPPRRG